MKDQGRHPHRHGLARISRKITGRVYVVHLDEPLGGPKHQARHYKGSVKAPKTAQERLQEHKDGKPGSAAILRAANERGIDYHVVCDWPGNPHIENQIKLYGATRICPECTPDTRVPLIVQAAIRAEKRQAQRAARKEAQAAAATGEAAARPLLDPYEDGRRMARQWLARQDEAGRTADQVEAAHEYVTGPWAEMAHHTEDQAERYRGYTESVQAALAEFREMEAETGPTGATANEMEAQMQGYDADGNAAAGADYDADAAQYEHDPGSWLARDGDGRVLEVDADGHPGREASPDDGRPAVEAQPEREDDLEARAPYPDHGWAVTDADGRRLAAIGVTGPGGERFTTWSAAEQGARVAWPGYTHELISDREAEAG